MSNLPATKLASAQLLAREGNRDIVIRKTLGYTPTEWKRLKEADDSSLAEALAIGKAEGAAEIVGFMKRMMTERDSMRAAEWLGERIYDLRPPSNSGNPDDIVPRVIINLGVERSATIEEYRAARIIEHDG